VCLENALKNHSTISQQHKHNTPKCNSHIFCIGDKIKSHLNDEDERMQMAPKELDELKLFL
jgi:hypothetical protein